MDHRKIFTENCPDCTQFAPDCNKCFDNPQKRKTGAERVFYCLYDKYKQLLGNNFATLERVNGDIFFRIYTTLTEIKDLEKFNFFLYYREENLSYSYIVKNVGLKNGFLFLEIEKEY